MIDYRYACWDNRVQLWCPCAPMRFYLRYYARMWMLFCLAFSAYVVFGTSEFEPIVGYTPDDRTENQKIRPEPIAFYFVESCFYITARLLRRGQPTERGNDRSGTCQLHAARWHDDRNRTRSLSCSRTSVPARCYWRGIRGNPWSFGVCHSEVRFGSASDALFKYSLVWWLHAVSRSVVA